MALAQAGLQRHPWAMAYEMHEYMVAPARSRPQLWRLALGLVLGTAAYVVFLAIFFGVIGALTGVNPEQLFDTTTPTSTLLVLGSFAAMTFGVWVVAKLLHLRSLGSLIGPWQLARQDFWATFKICGILMGLSLLLPAPLDIQITPNLTMGTWATLLPLSIILLFIQISAEELVFRGYFQSQMAAKFTSRILWIGVPAICFGLAHYDPSSAGENAPLIALWAVIYGIMLGDITARAGNIGPACALHFLNNAMAILLVAPQGDLSGLALYHYPFDMTDTAMVRTLLPIDLAMMGVMWLGARLAIKR